MKEHYVIIRHPITGSPIAVVPTGETRGKEAKGRVITPRANVLTVWFKKEDIIT